MSGPLQDAHLQVVYVIRHGARLDYEMGKDRYHEYCGGVMSHDPPLSSYGTKQASDMAARLSCLANEEVISKLIVSPFLRCIETAAPIAETLGLKLSVDDGLWEAGQTELYLPPTNSRSCPHIDAAYTSTFRPAPTESFPLGCLSRCAHVVRNLIDDRFQNENMIIVSHAATVVGIVGAMLRCPIADVLPAAPTGIYKLTRPRKGPSSTWTCVLQSDVSHLDEPDADGGYRGTQPWPSTARKSSVVFIEAGEDPSFWCNQSYGVGRSDGC